MDGRAHGRVGGRAVGKADGIRGGVAKLEPLISSSSNKLTIDIFVGIPFFEFFSVLYAFQPISHPFIIYIYIYIYIHIYIYILMLLDILEPMPMILIGPSSKQKAGHKTKESQ